MVLEDLKILLYEEVREFILEHTDDDVDKLLLSKKYANLPMNLIAEQIKNRKKAEKKFPGVKEKIRLYSSLAFEQSSSEAAARYKSSLMSGKRMIDMTGGFGVDTYYLSEKFSEVTYCERSQVLSEMFQINFLSGESNVEVVTGDSVEKIKHTPDDYYDWIYIDPARREDDRKTVDLEYCSPNVYEILDLMKKKSKQICIKVSPAFDYTEAKRKLPGLSDYIVVSVDNECKEVLLIVGRREETVINKKAVGLNVSGDVVFEYAQSEDSTPERVIDSVAGKYFYEPDLSIIKAGLSEHIAVDYKLSFFNDHADYLTGNKLIEDFPGRKFMIVGILPYNNLKKYLKESGIKKANIARRDFRLNVEGIRKELRIKEGGNEYLFFTKNNEGKSIAVHARR